MGTGPQTGAEAHPHGETKAQSESVVMSGPAGEPEFYVNATLGFRQWQFGLGARECEAPSLESMVRYGFHQPRYRWKLEGPNQARCQRLNFQPGTFYGRHGAVPAMGCSCGFYAHGCRDDSNSETTVHMVGGVVAGWGNLELHEQGFKCGVAKILALFAPDPHKKYADYDGTAQKKWAALESMCADNDIPLLPPDSLRNEEEVRRYAYERDLVLLEDQLSLRGLPLADTGS